MALNFSHRPVFPAHISEDNLVSPMRIVNGYLVEGVPEKNVENFARSGFDYGYGGKRVENCDSSESVSEDIVDLLPADPFGMDISTTITAISGWLEDLGVDYGGCRRNNHVGPSNNEDYGLFAGLNYIWNDAMRFHQSFPSSHHVRSDDLSCADSSLSMPHPCWILQKCATFGESDKHPSTFLKSQSNVELNRGDQVNWFIGERDMRDALAHVGLGSACNVGDIAGVNNNVGSGSFLPETMEAAACATSCSVGEDEGAPHEALSFALGYLGVKDLLNVESVCRSLQVTVKNDPLLWRSIHIESPLNEISDDILLQLTSRAQGNLQCLSLLECSRITDDGLRRVLDSNPRLTKLFVPACTRLSVDGIVNMLKSYNCQRGMMGIKHLRIGGLYGVTHEHVEELRCLLGADSQTGQNVYKPHFFSRWNIYRLSDDDRAIDVQICPRCEKMRLVYDCPAEGCQVKDEATQECRACSLCILRCSECGRCINNTEYEETFCLELLCSDCFKQPLKLEDEQEGGEWLVPVKERSKCDC
ncbi:F-box protein SKIP14-like [Lycium ferocissimum]|uniref:F-box protein SKIP14-like n=1 Tax=Lycium ferocissimum TaxID=112874 RepID=UPI00281573C6|nr:F-box protein SKIP14-like [Lycium ferocissimum]